jgi:hypothetical protein
MSVSVQCTLYLYITEQYYVFRYRNRALFHLFVRFYNGFCWCFSQAVSAVHSKATSIVILQFLRVKNLSSFDLRWPSPVTQIMARKAPYRQTHLLSI